MDVDIGCSIIGISKKVVVIIVVRATAVVVTSRCAYPRRWRKGSTGSTVVISFVVMMSLWVATKDSSYRRCVSIGVTIDCVVFFTVLSTSIEFDRITPGRRISTSVWKRSRSSASR